MFKRENADYPEFIWEDIAYQVDQKKEKRSRRENMPYLRFTKIIINHFLKQHKSLSNLNYQHYYTIKDDGIVSRLKFVIIGEDYQEYGLPILDVMLTDAIKHTPVEEVEVFEESDPEPAKKKTASRRVVKKNVTISAEDNIIPDPDVALELGKSISQTKAEAAMKVHATHARIVTEHVPESARRRKSGKVTSDPARKLKGVPSLTPAEQEATDIMQALKESRKSSRRQPGTGGSSEGTGTIPGVPDESTVVSATSSEGTDSKYSDDDNDDVDKYDKDGDVNDEGDDHISDIQDADDEDVETKSDEDEIYKYKIRVRKDKDVEMENAEVKESDKGDEDVTDAAKEDAEKTSEVKDDTKKTELPPTSSSLSVSSGFGDEFLKLSSNSSLVSTVKDSADANIMIPETTNLPPIPEILTETIISTDVSSHQVTTIISSVQQTPTPIPTPPITTDAPTITTAVTESNALTAVELRVAKLEKDVSELKNVDHSTEALAILKSQVPTVVDSYLDSKVGDVFQQELQKHTANLIQKYSLQHLHELTKKHTPTVNPEQDSEKSPSDIIKIKKEQGEKQHMSKFTIKSTDKATLEEYDLKSALYQSMHAKKSFNRNPANHRLYHALIEALIEDENAMDKGVADTVKDLKRKHDDDEDDDDKDPLARPKQGKAPTKGSKTSKSAKEPVEEPIAEVVMDDTGDDVARNDNQPQDTSEPNTRKTPNPEWFKQPPRPHTPDPEWNKHQDMPSTFKLDWNNPKGDRYPFDLSKPLPLQGPPGHLEYLKTSDLEAILGVKSVSVKKLHGYGHLEKIIVKRSDQQLYKFKECDFVDLHLNDIEDMLILAVQHKLFHLDDNDIVDFIADLGLMVDLIDKQLREREIIRNLERLVGARELEMDYKLMTCTI
ncbi:hypothetical protein Tco_0287088 [Tanacetum coccineum]